MAVNVAQAYQDSKIRTAAPADLTLMLYEGAIKFCNLAIIGIEKKDIEKAHINIMKTQRIVLEFKATLNHKYPVAKEFDLIYDYLYRLLVQANVKKDITILTEVIGQFRDMRDIWKQVMEKSKPQDQSGRTTSA